jgi:hypothetical protein
MDAKGFRDLCHVLLNVDLDDLETAGVITPGAKGGSDWRRFNTEPLIFVLKLPDARRWALWKMIEERMPDAPLPVAPVAEFLFLDGEDRAGECAP